MNKISIFILLMVMGAIGYAFDLPIISPEPISGQNQISTSQSLIYFTNPGINDIPLSLQIDSNSFGVYIGANRCGSIIKPLKTCYIIVSFPNYGKLSSELSLNLKNVADSNNQQIITLLKYSPPAIVQHSFFSASSLVINDFSNYTLSITNKTLSNKSYSPIFSGSNASNFNIVLNRCQNVPPKGKCDLIIKQKYQLPGSYSAILSESQVENSVNINSVITSLTNGALTPSNSSLIATPNSIDFGTLTNLSPTPPQTITITNNGNTSISPISNINGDGLEISLNRCLTILLPYQSCSVSVLFRPNSLMSNGSRSLSFEIQGNPSISNISIPITVNLNINSLPTMISQEGSVSSGISISSDFFIKTTSESFFKGASYSYNVSTNKFYSWGLDYKANYDAFTFGRPTPFLMDVNIKLSGKTIKQIATSNLHTCLIASDDKVYCWGNNYSGQLGNGIMYQTSVLYPAAVIYSGVLLNKTIKQIGVSESGSCVIASDDLVYCWGSNSNGQLGNGAIDRSIQYVPVAVDMSGVLAGKTIKQLNVEKSYACVIASDNRVYCWGYGYLGNGISYGSTGTSDPVAVDWTGVLAGKTAKYLSTSDNMVCLIANDNKAYCWGKNNYGQLGNGGITTSLVPVAVDMSGSLAGKQLNSIVIGFNTAFGITTDNKIFAWGSNNHGAMGINNSANLNSILPTEIYMSGSLSGKTIKKLSVSPNSDFSCIVASDDKVYCWGDNQYGQLGSNLSGSSLAYSLAPILVYDGGAMMNKIIKAISVGTSACAVSNDDQVFCWGKNSYGQLGDGTRIDRFYPVAAAPLL